MMNDGPSPNLSPKATTCGDVCLRQGEEFGIVADGKAFSLFPPTTGADRMMNFGERDQPSASAS